MEQRSSCAVKVLFTKRKELIFISHLDVVRLFIRTFRRANLPILFTQGYHPRPKISFKRALPLGVKGKREEMIIRLTERMDLKALKKKLNSFLPKGIQIIKMTYKEKR